MGSMKRIAVAVAMLLASAMAGQWAQACMVCIPFPEATAIDDLLDYGEDIDGILVHTARLLPCPPALVPEV